MTNPKSYNEIGADDNKLFGKCINLTAVILDRVINTLINSMPLCSTN